MTTPRTLTFDDCRTRREAEAALRDFLRAIVVDAQRHITTSVLLGVDQVDVDELDAVLGEIDAAANAATDKAVRVFNEILDGDLRRGGAES